MKYAEQFPTALSSAQPAKPLSRRNPPKGSVRIIWESAQFFPPQPRKMPFALQEKSSKKAMNKMRNIVIEKLILNISVGASGDKLTKAIKVLKDLTGQTPVTSKAK